MASHKLLITDTIPLPNSTAQIPRLGFGVYEAVGQDCQSAVLAALQAGYRHLDTAQLYENEKEVGFAFRQSGLKRSEVFITTKFDEVKDSPEATYQSLLDSVKAIDGEDGYVDLFLVHAADVGPVARKKLWFALEKLLEAGKTKAIGVSNYGIAHIEEMKEYAKIWPPMVNQIELHPWCQQPGVVKYCQKHGIIVEAYCPLVKNTRSDDSTLTKIAQSHGVSWAQVLIRYSLQKNWTPLPKSITPSRIVQNSDVYGFELSEEEMEMLDGLDQGASGSLYEFVDPPKDF